MEGEKVYFRKKVFGGFNREDVISYIAKIAEERNDAHAGKYKAEKKAQMLAEEVIKLREEMNALIAAAAEKEAAAADETEITYDEQEFAAEEGAATIEEGTAADETEITCDEQMFADEEETAAVDEEETAAAEEDNTTAIEDETEVNTPPRVKIKLQKKF